MKTNAQVVVLGGTTAAGAYLKLSAAVAAINLTALTGPVTVDVITGHTGVRLRD